MMEHELKTWPEYFVPVLLGAKAFEVRRNDRNFTVGDTLKLREWDQYLNEYTGRELSVTVTYKMKGTSWPDPCATPKPSDAIQSDFVVMGISGPRHEMTCPSCAALRAERDAAIGAKEKAEGALCSFRDTLLHAIRDAIADAENCRHIEKLSGNVVKEELAKGEHLALRLVEEWILKHPSAPCPHELAEKRLRGQKDGAYSERDQLIALLSAIYPAQAREALELVVSDFEMRDRHQSGRDEKRSNLCLAALASSSPCALRAAIAEHEPGELIAEITCPACGRELRVEHGDDEGEIGVLTK